MATALPAAIVAPHPGLAHVMVMMARAGIGLSKSVITSVDGLTKVHAMDEPDIGISRVVPPVVVAVPEMLCAFSRASIRMPARGAGSNTRSTVPSYVKPNPDDCQFRKIDGALIVPQ